MGWEHTTSVRKSTTSSSRGAAATGFSAMQHDQAVRGVPAAALRACVGNSVRKLGEGGVDLPPRPQETCEPLARLARQTELMAGAAGRLSP